MFLVAALSARWDWYPTREPAGKVVWCEIEALSPARRGAGEGAGATVGQPRTDRARPGRSERDSGTRRRPRDTRGERLHRLPARTARCVPVGRSVTPGGPRRPRPASTGSQLAPVAGARRRAPDGLRRHAHPGRGAGMTLRIELEASLPGSFGHKFADRTGTLNSVRYLPGITVYMALASFFGIGWLPVTSYDSCSSGIP